MQETLFHIIKNQIRGCRACQVRLASYIAVELPSEADSAVRAHLRECIVCQKEESAQRSLSLLLSRSRESTPVALPPADLWQRIEAEIQPASVPTGTQFRWQPAFATVGAVAAACGLVAYLRPVNVTPAVESVAVVQPDTVRPVSPPHVAMSAPKAAVKPVKVRVMAAVVPRPKFSPLVVKSTARVWRKSRRTASQRPVTRLAIAPLVQKPVSAPRLAQIARVRTPVAHSNLFGMVVSDTPVSERPAQTVPLPVGSANVETEMSSEAVANRSEWITTAMAEEPKAVQALYASESVSSAGRRFGLFSHQMR